METLVAGFAIDDFALDEKTGMAYLAGGDVGQVLKVSLERGEVEVEFSGRGLGRPTSIGVSEEGMIYVTTQEGKVVGIQRV